MPVPKGYRQTPEHRAAIGAAARGRKHPRADRECRRCGAAFRATKRAFYCSNRCRKGAQGATRITSPAFDHFERICAICDVTDDLVGDHDHATGKARGILCRYCNLNLGHLRGRFRSPSRLRALARYLEEASR